MNSRDKGKRGELEFAHFLKDNHVVGNNSQEATKVPTWSVSPVFTSK